MDAAWLADWDGSGAAAAAAAFASMPAGEGVLQGKGARGLLYELCWAVATNLLAAERLGLLLGECAEHVPELGSALADVLYVCYLKAEKTLEPAGPKARLGNLANHALSEGWVGELLLKERWEPDMLASAKVVESQLVFNKRVVRTRTSIHFTQKKFNLLREESEGYSKLAAELNQELQSATVGVVFQNVQSLIGYFDLDPNRVFDIFLDVSEQQPDNAACAELARLFKPHVQLVTQLLGFKFQYFQRAEVTEKTPPSLFKLAAVLLKGEFVQLEQLLPHLGPPLEVAKAARKKARAYNDKQARRYGVVSLSGKDPTEEQIAAKKKEKFEATAEERLDDQRIGLLEGLVVANDMASAMALHETIAFLQPAAKPNISSALCAALHRAVELPYALTPVGKTLHKLGLRGGGGEAAAAAADEPAELSAAMMEPALPLLTLLGPSIANDGILFAKLCRILQPLLKSADASSRDAVVFLVEKLVSTVLLPGLSLTTANCGLSNELWSVLKSLPYTNRFRLYAEFKSSGYKADGRLIKAEAESRYNTRGATQRIANETIRQQGRVIGKVAHSNPLIVFQKLAETVQAMPNTILVLTDALRYCTDLSFDVLSFTLIECMSNPTKKRIKDDGLHTADWLTALSTFAGSCCRKYNNIEIAGMLQYVGNQLKDGNVYDLLVLKDLVTKMGGIEDNEDMTNDKLMSQAGGDLLRIDAQFLDQRVKANPRSAKRLLTALVDSQLVAPLLVLISQRLTSCIFESEIRASEKDLRLATETCDQINGTLLQFSHFLNSNLDSARYQGMLPSLAHLLGRHGLSVEAAFHIARPVLHLSTSISDRVDLPPDVIPAGMAESGHPGHTALFVTFWSLNLYDIHVPNEQYREGIKKAEKASQKCEQEQRNAHGSLAKAKGKEAKALREKVDKVRKEQKAQQAHHEIVMKRIKAESAAWFDSDSTNSEVDIYTLFAQHCIFPRLLFSPQDAMYASKFVEMILTHDTPQFSTLLYYDRVFKHISAGVYCCTFNEARRLGLFMNEALKRLDYWRNERVYGKECKNKPGFAGKVASVGNHITFKEFAKLAYKWHTKLIRLFSDCLEKDDYIPVRNSLIVMKACEVYFPKVTKHLAHVEKRVEKLTGDDKRKDLKNMAMAYKASMELRSPTMMADDVFRAEKATAKPPPKEKSSSSRAEPAQSKRKEPPRKESIKASAKDAEPKAEPEKKRSRGGHSSSKASPEADAGGGKPPASKSGRSGRSDSRSDARSSESGRSNSNGGGGARGGREESSSRGRSDSHSRGESKPRGELGRSDSSKSDSRSRDSAPRESREQSSSRGGGGREREGSGAREGGGSRYPSPNNDAKASYSSRDRSSSKRGPPEDKPDEGRSSSSSRSRSGGGGRGSGGGSGGRGAGSSGSSDRKRDDSRSIRR